MAQASASTTAMQQDNVFGPLRVFFITRYTLYEYGRLPSLLFLSRVSILTRDIDVANLSVCLSVCP